ncbi:MAG: hypothetical protein ACHQPI_05470 [Thermoanaerobaculia bacterium]
MNQAPGHPARLSRMRISALLAILAAAVALAFVIYSRVIVPAGPLDWDEGFHALHGLRAATEIREGDLFRLAYDVYRSVYWPPLHALYSGVFLLSFGATAEVARTSSLAAYVAAAGLLALAALRVRGTVAALVAGFGFLLSPLAAKLAGKSLLEIPALALFSLALFLYVDGRRPVLLGLSVFATYLTRTNYGVLLALGLTGAFAIDGALGTKLSDGDLRRSARRDALRALTALAVPLALWFAYTPKIGHTLAALVNLPTGPSRFGVEGLLYYPRAAVKLAGSLPLLLVYSAVFALSLSPRALRDRSVRLVAFLALLQILFAEISHTKLDRHILPLAVLFPFLLGVMAEDVRGRGNAAVKTSMAGVFALLVALQVPALFAFLTPATTRGGETVRIAVVREMSRGGRTAFVASEDALVPPATCDFALVSGGAIPLGGAGALRTTSELRLAESAATLPGPVGRWIRAEADRWPGAGSYSAYVGLPRGDAALRLTTGSAPVRLAALLARFPVDRIVALADPEGTSFPVTPEFLERLIAPLGFGLESSLRPVPGTALLTFRKLVPPARAPAPGPPAP